MLEKPALSDFMLETERLRLLPLTMAYLQHIFRNFDEEIARYMYPSAAKQPEETAQFIRKAEEGFRDGSNLQLVILDKAGATFLGCVGAHDLHTKAPELGIWLKKTVHGQGYGLEATAALKHWLEAHCPFEYLLYPVDARNYPSRRIPEALGGQVFRQYICRTPGNKLLDILEYRLYAPNTEPPAPSPATLRLARTWDALKIGRISALSWRDTYRDILDPSILVQITAENEGKRYHQRLQKKQVYTVVAEDGEHMVGFATIGPSRREDIPYRHELYAIYLLRTYQRRGIGQAMVQHLLKIRPEFKHGLWVEVFAQNPSVAFYEKIGAKVIAEEYMQFNQLFYPTLLMAWDVLKL